MKWVSNLQRQFILGVLLLFACNTYSECVENGADLRIFMTAPVSAIAGEEVIYEIQVDNSGPCAANNIQLTDLLPFGSTLVSIDAPGWVIDFSQLPGTINAALAQLPANGSKILHLTIMVPASLRPFSVIQNFASVSSDVFDPELSNNTGYARTTTQSVADISITKTAPATIAADEDITYTITISNTGPSDVYDITFIDQLPYATSLVSITTPEEWTNLIYYGDNPLNLAPEEYGTPLITTPLSPGWNISTPAFPLFFGSNLELAITHLHLPAGSSVALALVTHVREGLPNSTILTNHCLLKDDPNALDDSDRTNNASQASTTVVDVIDCVVSDWSDWSTCTGSCGEGIQTRTRTIVTPAQNGGVECPALIEIRTCEGPPTADLGVFKRAPASVIEGGLIDYTITVNNSGPCAASNVEITDFLPAGSNVVSIDAPGWIIDFNQLPEKIVAVYIYLPKDDNPSFDFTLEVSDVATDQIQNTVKISTPTGEVLDPDSTNNTSQVFTTVLKVVDCVVSDWSDWSTCSVSCGDGIQTRTRTIVTPAQNGGKECSELVEARTCNAGPGYAYYLDADGDGYGNAAVSILACVKPPGYVINDLDCNDASASVSPGAPELCNGIDDNCNGKIDEGFKLKLKYPDADGDGFGNSNSPNVLVCKNAQGWVKNNKDCNDANAAIHPGSHEICNGIDDNCNHKIDEGCNKHNSRDNNTFSDNIDDKLNNGRQINVYPNPFNHVFNIRMEGFENAEIHITIVNTLGQVLLDLTRKGDLIVLESLDLMGYSNGLYLINIMSSDLYRSYRVIKE